MKTRRQAFLLGVVVFVSISFLARVAGAQSDQDQSAPSTGEGSQATSPNDDLPLPPSVAGGGELGPDYVVGPEDILIVDVFNVPSLKQTVRVDNDGTITVKLLGRVTAAGLTTKQLKEELQTEWGKDYLENPEVTIFVREFHGRPVSVIGAVEKPNLYQLPGPRNLIEVLAMAGGLAKRTNGGPGRTLYVTRKGGFGVLDPTPGMQQVASDQIEIDLQQLLYSHDDSLNIPIKPFDIISVTKAGIVYVVGEVKKPGGFTLEDKENVSVLQALAMAEGLNGNAAKRAARIIHRNQDGSLTETAVDVGKILDGKSQDVQLVANDVLFVPNSRAKYAGKRTAESVIATLTGLIVFRGL
jgi:polysaccharide biosynthesis/export protein